MDIGKQSSVNHCDIKADHIRQFHRGTTSHAIINTSSWWINVICIGKCNNIFYQKFNKIFIFIVNHEFSKCFSVRQIWILVYWQCINVRCIEIIMKFARSYYVFSREWMPLSWWSFINKSFAPDRPLFLPSDHLGLGVHPPVRTDHCCSFPGGPCPLTPPDLRPRIT